MYENRGTTYFYNPTYSVAFTPTTANETMIFGYAANVLATSKVWLPFKTNGTGNGITNFYQGGLWADSGTLDHLYAAATSSLSTGQYVLAATSGANASDSLVTCTFNTSANNCNDLSDATSTVAGNYSTLSSTPTAPDTRSLTYGARFVPTTAGNFEIFGQNPYLTANSYLPITGNQGPSLVEASTSIYAQPMVITALYAQTSSAVTSRTYTLMDNGVATALTCTMTGTTKCSITGQSVTVNQGDELDYYMSQTGAQTGYTTMTLSAHALPPAAPASSQILFGGSITGMGGNIRNAWLPPNSIVNMGNFNNTSDISDQAIAPVSGTLSSLYVTSTDPVTVGTVAFTLYVNLNATVLTCTIAISSTSCSDNHTVSIHAGDNFGIKETQPNVGSGNIYEPRYSIKFTPTTPNQTMLLGGIGPSLLNTSTQYFMPWGGFMPGNTASSNYSNYFADSGTISNFYAAATTTTVSGSYALAAGGGANGTASALTCSIGTGASSCSDTTDATTTIAGVTLSSLVSTPSSPSPLAIEASAAFVPNTPGNFEIFSFGYGITSAGYMIIVGQNAGGSTFSTVEASTTVPAQPMVVTALYVGTNAQAPGSGATRTITLNDNGVATALACTMSGASQTSCSSTGKSVTINQGDSIDYHITQTGSPSNQTLRVTLSAHTPTSVRQSYPSTPAKNGFWGGVVKILGGFLRIK